MFNFRKTFFIWWLSKCFFSSLSLSLTHTFDRFLLWHISMIDNIENVYEFSRVFLSIVDIVREEKS